MGQVIQHKLDTIERSKKSDNIPRVIQEKTLHKSIIISTLECVKMTQKYILC